MKRLTTGLDVRRLSRVISVGWMRAGIFTGRIFAASWSGVGAPAKTPSDVIRILNKQINAALADPKIKMRLADLGNTVTPGSPADFANYIGQETKKWAKVIKFADIQPI